MKITLKDGGMRERADAMSTVETATGISRGLARMICTGEVNRQVVDLHTVVDRDCEPSILTANDKIGPAVYRHTTGHVLVEVTKCLYSETELTIGPSIDTGFYYDFDTPLFSREDLGRIETEMKKIIKEGAKIERFTLPRKEAIQFMEEKDEPYKVELIQDLSEDARIFFYRQGNFVSLCAGPYLVSMRLIRAFRLISPSGVYWRGSEENVMPPRIYGTVLTEKGESGECLGYLENIRKRDHNRLGRELELFATVDMIGQGLPLLMLKGAKIIQAMQR